MSTAVCAWKSVWVGVVRPMVWWPCWRSSPALYPAPAFIRSDNGPEFIAHALRTWCKNSGTAIAHIEPGSPWQNGFAESFNSQFRDEFLNTKLFTTVAEAQGLANRWRWEYNTFRPHSALQRRAPLEAAQAAAA